MAGIKRSGYRARIQSRRPVQTVAMVSLGCAKNLVDTEKMLGLMAEHGLIPVADQAQADAIIINTCGFLAAARDESIEHIRQAIAQKQTGRCRRVIVAGCLAQRSADQLPQWCNGIDAIVGVFDRHRIVEAVTGTDRNISVYHSDQPQSQWDDRARLRVTPSHYAYLRLSEGCNQRCAFCTIPGIRGPLHSKPLQEICDEAEQLLSSGAMELILIAQDTTAWGTDLPGKETLAEVLTALDQRVETCQPDGWIRLMYAYPNRFSDTLIECLGSLKHLLPYLDMPLQHINDRILKQMRRQTSRQHIEQLLNRLRDRIDNLAVRTTLIAGFPTETEDEFQELVEFVNRQQFEALGVFGYSHEPGTPAYDQYHTDQLIPPPVIAQRVETLMLNQQQQVFARNQALADTGRRVEILIDQSLDPATAEYQAIGRTAHQAPEVDAVCLIQTDQPISPGQIISCRITDWRDYDLVATDCRSL